MAIEPEYRELFSESVTLYPKARMDKYGRRSHAASASIQVPAHIVGETKLVRTTDGREVVQTGNVYLYGYFPNIDTDYLIVLPDGSSPVVIMVDTPFDEVGGHHTVVGIGA